MIRRTLLLAPALAAVLCAPAAARTDDVAILFDAFATPQTDVLVGDTVTWRNDSVRAHTIDALNGSWQSGGLAGGLTFSHRFDSAGSFAYLCRIHPFMRGEVDAYATLLDRPSAAAQPGRDFPVSGRSALPAGSPVTIEADEGAGYAPVAHTVVGDDGDFHAAVRPHTAARLRATAGSDASPPVQLLVLDRTVALTARSGRDGRIALSVRVTPASPKAHVVVQLRLREHFGWWPVRSGRLDGNSAARFLLRPGRRIPARVLLTLPDGATPLAVSPTLRVGRRSARP